MYQHRASSFPTHPSQGELTESPGFKCYLQLMIPKLISLARSSSLNSSLINPNACVISSLGKNKITLDLPRPKLCSKYYLHQYPMGSALSLPPFQCLRPKSLEPTWLPLHTRHPVVSKSCWLHLPRKDIEEFSHLSAF